jgi:hypothetical protein
MQDVRRTSDEKREELTLERNETKDWRDRTYITWNRTQRFVRYRIIRFREREASSTFNHFNILVIETKSQRLLDASIVKLTSCKIANSASYVS